MNQINSVRRLTEIELLDFGIEIIAAMKSDAYGVDIETGRIMALEDTELDRITEVDIKEIEGESLERIKDYVKREKQRLHNQSFYVAKIALEKLNSILRK
jgi:hypothetical protein